MADNGMVDFAVEVQNPNKTVEAVDPVIEVVGKDDGGNVIFDETIETTPACCPILPTITPMWPGPPPTPRPLQLRW